MTANRAPVNDAIVVALSTLVDDAQSGTREPSHSEIEFQINRSGLEAGDPRTQGQTVGKAKRVRAVLWWGLDNAPDRAEQFAASLISLVRGEGGFRNTSANYVGADAIHDLKGALRSEGYILSDEGELFTAALDDLSGDDLTDALSAYVRRAQRGSEDAALIVGTAKDLMEATAAHVISEKFGNYSHQANFPTLLGQAFVALNLATPQDPIQAREPPHRRLERALYEAACAVNAMRNRTGTGHGRPFAAGISQDEARAAIQVIGIVAGLLLRELKKIP